MGERERENLKECCVSSDVLLLCLLRKPFISILLSCRETETETERIERAICLFVLLCLFVHACPALDQFIFSHQLFIVRA